MTANVQISSAIRHLNIALALRPDSPARKPLIETAIAEAKLAAILAAEEERTKGT